MRKGATTIIFRRFAPEWMEKVRKAIFSSLHTYMHSYCYALLFYFFFGFVYDEVEVLLSFCGVIVSDIFCVLFSSVTIFPHTAEPTASSQKWRNATQKVKLQIDDESENHFVWTVQQKIMEKRTLKSTIQYASVCKYKVHRAQQIANILPAVKPFIYPGKVLKKSFDSRIKWFCKTIGENVA